MAQWIGIARSNYVELAPEVTLEDLQYLIETLGAGITFETEEKDGVTRVALFGAEEYGNFPSVCQVEIDTSDVRKIEALKAVLPEEKVEQITEAVDAGDEEVVLNDVEFSFEACIMPFIKVGEVLVLQEVGAEKLRYVTGWACAMVRRENDAVDTVGLNLDEIYTKARNTFGEGINPKISSATY
jgi:hypothetical protein